MSKNRLLTIGIVGMLVTALRSFTPALVAISGIIGLSARVAELDIVLLPLLAVFASIMVFVIWKRQKKPSI